MSRPMGLGMGITTDDPGSWFDWVGVGNQGKGSKPSPRTPGLSRLQHQIESLEEQDPI